ncbi:hypothetical protein DL1_11980 [Thioclava dalianensis]|uniref:Uncharacterized protein n=1 Tax=Thioclava dalianensis TaxID=1185766 RepID=A0A074U175_9RHOB|nr:hypothetical protein [Thioclava dalianensis]KEP68417.1 hypothetical protein DL1_11980 [Thioclava dalianensis]SFN62840.1 hypothetical protein SAMN05216224_10859 [Thioclava dalianensis]
MRNIAPAIQAAREAAPETGLITRWLAYFEAHNRTTGAVATFGFWSGDDDVSIQVVDGQTGTLVTRDYLGQCGLAVTDLVYSGGLDIYTASVTLYDLHPAVTSMLREYDVRLARTDLHAIEINPATQAPFGAYEPAFVGLVDDAPISEQIGDGSITLSVRSEIGLMLNRTNPAKSSSEEAMKRGGDTSSQYAGTVASWKIKVGGK